MTVSGLVEVCPIVRHTQDAPVESRHGKTSRPTSGFDERQGWSKPQSVFSSLLCMKPVARAYSTAMANWLDDQRYACPRCSVS